MTTTRSGPDPPAPGPGVVFFDRRPKVPVMPAGFRPAALLLDLDGTLVDSEPRHFAAHQRFLATLGCTVTVEDLVANIGRGDLAFYHGVLQRQGLHGDPTAWVVEKTRLLMELYRREGLPLRPGAAGLVHRAAAAGIFAYVVTSAERALAALSLEVTGLAALLPARVCYEDVTAHKPDPAPYLLAASRLGVPPARCLVVEDSPSGVRAGKAAGCTVIGFCGLIPAERLLEAGADRIVRHLDEVLP